MRPRASAAVRAVALASPLPILGRGLLGGAAVCGALLLGCSGDDGGRAASATEGTEDDSTATDPTSVETTDTEPTGSGGSSESGDASDTGDDTEPPLEGPGCDIEPVCDKGELLGSVRITSEADIESIAGYTSMTGWLEVYMSNMVCLDFLACLESVGHDITIYGNPDLRDFRGFDALTATGAFNGEDGFISIAENEALTDINGFASLQRINTSLSITENPNLRRVSGFGSLIVIEKDINIRFNPQLEDLSGPSGLLALGNECIITNNPSLCVSEAAAVCGDLEVPPASEGPPPGSTANNDDGC